MQGKDGERGGAGGGTDEGRWKGQPRRVWGEGEGVKRGRGADRRVASVGGERGKQSGRRGGDEIT